jgi:hypothetical protein
MECWGCAHSSRHGLTPHAARVAPFARFASPTDRRRRQGSNEVAPVTEPHSGSARSIGPPWSCLAMSTKPTVRAGDRARIAPGKPVESAKPVEAPKQRPIQIVASAPPARRNFGILRSNEPCRSDRVRQIGVPTSAVQRVGSYLMYSGRDADVFAAAAHEPQQPLTRATVVQCTRELSICLRSQSNPDCAAF